MPNDAHERLLKEISNWSTADVVALLKKNKLSECCSAIVKREVDGEELLHLSEGRLNLWKSDLPRPLRWDLCRFVEDLNENPKRYCTEDIKRTSPSPDQSDVPSDSELWDTDFEEDDEPSRSAGEDSLHNEDYNDSSEMYGNSNINPRTRASPEIPGNRVANDVEDDNDNIYQNGPEPVRPKVPPAKPMTSNGSSMVEKLKEQLLQLELKRNPSVAPKPKLMEKKPGIIKCLESKHASRHPQQSLRPIKNSNKIMPNLELIKNIEAANMTQPKRNLCPPKPINTPRITPAPCEKFEKFKTLQNLPKPPSTLPKIRNTNLTTAGNRRSEKNDDSDEYDYEPINAQKNGKQYNSSESLKSVNSTHSIVNGRLESAHNSPTDDNVDDNQDVYEIIPENYDAPDEYVKPISSKFNRPYYDTEPRPSTTRNMKERPLDLKSATVPYSKSSRPLPPPPINGPKPDRPVEIPDRNFDIPSYTEQPWFHNIGRDEAIALIEGGTSKFSVDPPDGYFLLRPSSANMNQPWTLVLWYKNKVYNIAVRKRPDTRYALGRVKPKEQSFNSIEEMITFYKENDLVLNSGNGDVAVGSTRLTETPPK